MTLLHVRFADRLDAGTAAKAVLAGYRGRYSALADAVTETEPVFDDERPRPRCRIVDLLTEPVYVLAERVADGRLTPAGGVPDRWQLARSRARLGGHRPLRGGAGPPARPWRDRLFTAGERAYAARLANPVPSLAARFAAKEAVMKALGVGLGAFDWDDVEVVRRRSGRPGWSSTGRAAAPGRRPGRRRVAGLASPTPTRSRRRRRVVAALS